MLGIAARSDVAIIGEWTGLYAYRFFADRRAPDLALSDAALDLGGSARSDLKRR